MVWGREGREGLRRVGVRAQTPCGERVAPHGRPPASCSATFSAPRERMPGRRGDRMGGAGRSRSAVEVARTTHEEMQGEVQGEM